MRLGFHMPIKGGLSESIARSLRVGAEGLQIFTRSPRSWRAKPLDADEVHRFKIARKKSGLDPLVVHLPYLPNMAASEKSLRKKSITLLSEELARANQIGADYLVAHPGYVRRTQSSEKAIALIGEAAAEALAALEGGGVKVRLLIENTSRRKGELGGDFKELALIIKALDESGKPDSFGICLDTAHAWGAGYDLASQKGLDDTLLAFDNLIGLDRLFLIHLNDSLVELGSCRDRHAAPGLGRIGSKGMARLVRHKAFRRLAGLMETPRETEETDVANMARIKRWRKN